MGSQHLAPRGIAATPANSATITPSAWEPSHFFQSVQPDFLALWLSPGLQNEGDASVGWRSLMKDILEPKGN